MYRQVYLPRHSLAAPSKGHRGVSDLRWRLMTEKSIQQLIRERAAKLNIRLFRNNVGVLRDDLGKYVTYGLCVGSSDLIGDCPVNGIAVFLAVEVKRPGGKVTVEQHAFISSVNARGGIALSCDSVESFESQLKEKIDDLQQMLRARDSSGVR